MNRDLNVIFEWLNGKKLSKELKFTLRNKVLQWYGMLYNKNNQRKISDIIFKLAKIQSEIIYEATPIQLSIELSDECCVTLSINKETIEHVQRIYQMCVESIENCGKKWQNEVLYQFLSIKNFIPPNVNIHQNNYIHSKRISMDHKILSYDDIINQANNLCELYHKASKGLEALVKFFRPHVNQTKLSHFYFTIIENTSSTEIKINDYVTIEIMSETINSGATEYFRVRNLSKYEDIKIVEVLKCDVSYGNASLDQIQVPELLDIGQLVESLDSSNGVPSDCITIFPKNIHVHSKDHNHVNSTKTLLIYSIILQY